MQTTALRSAGQPCGRFESVTTHLSCRSCPSPDGNVPPSLVPVISSTLPKAAARMRYPTHVGLRASEGGIDKGCKRDSKLSRSST